MEMLAQSQLSLREGSQEATAADRVVGCDRDCRRNCQLGRELAARDR